MKRLVSFMVTVLILVLAMALGYALAKWGGPPRGEAGRSGSIASAVSTVETVPIRWGKIFQSSTAYGTVVANPRLEQSLSVAFASRVLKLYVVRGQRVRPHQPLLRIQASPAERLKLAEAKNLLHLAAVQLRLTEAKRRLEFATESDVVTARNALVAASLRLAALRRLGIGPPMIVRAPEEAIVLATPAVPGRLEPRGAVLLDVLPMHATQVKLSVLPLEARQLRLGQKVDISVAAPGGAIRQPGTISLIASRVDPDSGFVAVYVTPAKPQLLLIGQYASGRFHIASRVGLIVPHSAVLPDGGKEIMYTVRNFHAVLHDVRIGLSNHREVEVSAPGLHAGEPVVVVGNAELANGVPVQPVASSAASGGDAANAAPTSNQAGKQGNQP